ncbi:MAG: hypothetical protein KC933_20335 [Myxococcales bacterium]|nr:hypothetical protein [Myxococcales bacterium]
MTTMKAYPWLLAGAVTIFSGCGDDLVNNKYEGEVLTTIKGTLAAGTGQTVNGPVSLAILWLPPTIFVADEQAGGGPIPPRTGDGTGEPTCTGIPDPTTLDVDLVDSIAWVTQSVTYQAQFPINFQIPITSLPPANVRLDLADVTEGQGTWSMGVLVAYVDGNGNGQYDPGTPGNLPDQLLAASASQEGTSIDVIFYLDGTYPAGSDFDQTFGQIGQGFSLLSGSTSQAPMVRAATDPIELALGRNIQGADFNFTGCGQVEHRVETNGAIPTDAELFCYEDGYGWYAPETSPEPCVVVEKSGWACLAPGTPAPANWPCGN